MKQHYGIMRYFFILIALINCINSYSQELCLKVEYSTGVKDSIILGFEEDATLDIDSDYDEVNIFGVTLQPFDLRSIQRKFNSDNDCLYENIYEENIDTKVNIRQFDQNDITKKTFEIILNSPDTNFNIILKSSNIFVDSFISFEPDTCGSSGFPLRYRIEQNLEEIDLKPIMRFNGLTATNYIVLIIDEIGTTNTKELQTSNLSITPNPASDFVNITNQENRIEEISILDIFGKSIQYEKGFNSNEINIELNPFLQGLYLIRVKLDNNLILTQKLYID